LEYKNLLTEEGNAPDITDAVPTENKRLFEIADCGGLSIPGEFCYSTTTLALQYYTISSDEQQIKKLIYSQQTTCAVYVCYCCCLLPKEAHHVIWKTINIVQTQKLSSDC